MSMFSGTKRLFLIAIFIVVLIALVNVVWWLYYERTASLLDRQLSRRLTAVAVSGSAALTPQLVEDLTNFDPEAYITVTDILEDIRRLPRIVMCDEGNIEEKRFVIVVGIQKI